MGVWRQIDEWLLANALDVHANLRAPATAAELDKAESELGRRLPAALREAYLAHDGMADEYGTVFWSGARFPPPIEDSGYGWSYWLPLARALEKYRWLCENGKSPGRSSHWPEERFPFAGTDNLYLVTNLATATVGFVDMEDWQEQPLAPSFAGWVEQMAADMGAGLVEMDDESEIGGLVVRPSR